MRAIFSNDGKPRDLVYIAKGYLAAKLPNLKC